MYREEKKRILLAEKHRGKNTAARFGGPESVGRRAFLARTLLRGGQREKELLSARFVILVAVSAESDF